MGIKLTLLLLYVCFTDIVKADEDDLTGFYIRISLGGAAFIVMVASAIAFFFFYKKKRKQAQVRANHTAVPICQPTVGYVPNQPPQPPAYGQYYMNQPPPAYGQYSTPPDYGQKSDLNPPAYPPPPANY